MSRSVMDVHAAKAKRAADEVRRFWRKNGGSEELMKLADGYEKKIAQASRRKFKSKMRPLPLFDTPQESDANE